MHCQVSYRLKDENLFVSREIKTKVATQTSSSLVKSINMLHASSVEPIEFFSSSVRRIKTEISSSGAISQFFSNNIIQIYSRSDYRKI